MSGRASGPRLGAADVELQEDRELYRGVFSLRLLRLRHRLFSGRWSEVLRRELFQRPDAGMVLLHDPERAKVALVEQFRPGALGRDGASPWLLELVAGMVAAAETPLQAARREVREETGLEVAGLRPLGRCHTSPGGCREQMHLFYARTRLQGKGGIHGQAAEHKDIQVHFLALDECLEALAQERWQTSAPTLFALHWLARQPGALAK